MSDSCPLTWAGVPTYGGMEMGALSISLSLNILGYTRVFLWGPAKPMAKRHVTRRAFGFRALLFVVVFSRGRGATDNDRDPVAKSLSGLPVPAVPADAPWQLSTPNPKPAQARPTPPAAAPSPAPTLVAV